jgi:hypothetical protein
MNKNYILFLSTFSTFSVLAPVLSGAIAKIHRQRMLSTIFYLQCLTLIIEIFSWLLAQHNYNNMIIFNLFTLVEFFFIMLFFKIFFDQFSRTKLHFIIMILFFFLVLYTGFISEAFRLFDNLSVSIESIIFIIYSLISFFFIMKNLIYDNLLVAPFFWVNCGILIYFSGNLFYFAFSNYLQKNTEQSLLQLSVIHSIFNILYYVTLTIGFWKARKV